MMFRYFGIVDTSIAPLTLDKEFAATLRELIRAKKFAVAKLGSAGYPRHIAMFLPEQSDQN